MFIVGVFVLYGIKLATQWYIWRRERDKVEVYKMVERIIELLVNHQKNTSAGKQPFLAVNHIRDQLIPPPDRSRESYSYCCIISGLNIILS
jgi:hypothetical protein